MTDFQKQVIDLVGQDLCVSEIAHRLNRKMSSVSSVIARFKLKHKSKNFNCVNHHYFDNIDSAQKAYFLGLFISDGSVSGSRFSFQLSFDDGKELLPVLKEEINSDQKIYFCPEVIDSNGVKYRKPQAKFRWTSKLMMTILNDKYGIHSRKTYDNDFVFPFDKIPEEFIGSFILGVIDGDGSFEQSKGVFTPSLIGNSKYFLEQIGKYVFEFTGLTNKIYTHRGKTCEYYTIRFCANRKNKYDKICKLYNFLYDKNIVCLNRKKVKIINYLQYRAKQLGITPSASVERRD